MHRLASLDKLACEEMIVYNLQALLMKKSSHFLKMGIRVYDIKIGRVKIIAASVRQKRAPPWNSFSSAMLFGCVIAVDQG